MSKTIRTYIIGSTVCLLVSLCFDIESWASTTVSPSVERPCQHEVQVEVWFEFADQISPVQAADRLAIWKQAMESMWNGPTGTAGFAGGSCQARFTFDLKALPADTSCRSLAQSAHCMVVVPDALNRRGKVADATLGHIASGTVSRGEWTFATAGTEAAHLGGHILGLNESYEQQVIDADGILAWMDLDSSNIGNIMSQTWTEAAGLGAGSASIGQIMTQAGETCQLSCFCGNGILESERGEKCDTGLTVTGCAQGEICSSQCACEFVIPACGNGTLDEGEICDFAADPSGCDTEYKCNAACVCDSVEVVDVPRNDEVVYRTKCGDGTCDAGETCISCWNDCHTVLACPICGNNQCEGGEEFSCRRDCE